MHYGPDSTRQRPHDSGRPSSDTASSREPEGAGQASRDQPEDGCQMEEANGVNRLPEVTGDKEPKRKFKTYPIGDFHVDPDDKFTQSA